MIKITITQKKNLRNQFFSLVQKILGYKLKNLFYSPRLKLCRAHCCRFHGGEHLYLTLVCRMMNL